MSYANAGTVSIPSPQGWDPVQWLDQFWSFYVNLWPKMLDLEHQAAVLAATSPAGSAQHTLAMQAVKAVSQLMDIQTWVQKQAETYGLAPSTGTMGVVGLAIVGGTIAVTVAGLVWWSVLRYNALTQVVNGINAGTMTPSQGSALLSASGSPPGWGAITGAGALLLLAAVGAVIWFHVHRSRPEVVVARENPWLMVANPPEDEDGTWSHEVLSLDYIHDDDGEAYRHAFRPGVRMQALPSGDVRLYHPHKRIWREF